MTMYKLLTKTSEKWEGKATSDLYKLNQHCMFVTDNEYGLPIVESSNFTPTELIPFHLCKKMLKGDKHKTVHFFLDDYKFECVWSKPHRYLDILKYYGSVISPTFSIYDNQPFAMNLWNMYRSRWLTRYWQEHGIDVIVDVRWGSEETYDICFSGIKKGSKVIVNTVGTKYLANRSIFRLGFDEMIKRIEPSELYVYGEYIPVNFEEYVEKVHYFPSFWAEKRKNLNK